MKHAMLVMLMVVAGCAVDDGRTYVKFIPADRFTNGSVDISGIGQLL